MLKHLVVYFFLILYFLLGAAYKIVCFNFLCTNHSYHIARIVLALGSNVSLCCIAYAFCFTYSAKNEIFNIYAFGINQAE